MYTKSVEEKHHVFRIQVRNIANGIVFNGMTESSKVSSVEEASPVHQRKWTGCCEELLDFPKERVYGIYPITTTSSITTGNGSTCKNVPMSPVDLLSNGFFTPTGQYPECMTQGALYQVVTENENFAKFRENPKWNDALFVLRNDQAPYSHFVRVVNGSQSSHNEKSKSNYFTSLRYDVFSSCCSSTPEGCEVQRCHIRRPFGTTNEGTFDSASLTVWPT